MNRELLIKVLIYFQMLFLVLSMSYVTALGGDPNEIPAQRNSKINAKAGNQQDQVEVEESDPLQELKDEIANIKEEISFWESQKKLSKHKRKGEMSDADILEMQDKLKLIASQIEEQLKIEEAQQKKQAQATKLKSSTNKNREVIVLEEEAPPKKRPSSSIKKPQKTIKQYEADFRKQYKQKAIVWSGHACFKLKFERRRLQWGWGFISTDERILINPGNAIRSDDSAFGVQVEELLAFHHQKHGINIKTEYWLDMPGGVRKQETNVYIGERRPGAIQTDPMGRKIVDSEKKGVEDPSSWEGGIIFLPPGTKLVRNVIVTVTLYCPKDCANHVVKYVFPVE